jgi:hypothetical protein
MKRITYYLLLIILCSLTTGCNKKTGFTLKGELKGLASDTLVAYYQLPEYKIDTIICKNGIFEYSFTPDTTTLFTLILDSLESIPVYATKGETVEIKGTTTDFTIKGEGENKLMNEIFNSLRNTPKEGIINKVDSIISTNNYSFTNIYLIEKYFVRKETPDYTHIEKLIEKQSGHIKDTPYIMELQNRIELLKNKGKTQSIISLIGQNREGEKIKWATNRNNYILIDFWASWDPASVIEQDSLRSVLKALKKENFLIYSISLDLDKEAWMKASDRDTTQWIQVCDFKGWNNTILKNQGINALPANLLLDKNKRIIARNIRGKELIEKVKDLIQRDKEREKAAKKRKKK